MTPNFALGLTEHGITLWQRDGTDWLRLGAVALDAPDLDAQMAELAAQAHAAAPDGVVTKMVIPDEQVLYVRLPVTPDATSIRAALQGRTPYPVEELDFDWTIDDDAVRVAVVARETLIEAEDFAKEHGLNPVCFVAAPVAQGFAQEPFFKTARGVFIDPDDLGRGGPILRETGVVAPRNTAKDTPEAAPDRPPEPEVPKPEAATPPDPAPERPGPDAAKPAPDTPENGKPDSGKPAPKTPVADNPAATQPKPAPGPDTASSAPKPADRVPPAPDAVASPATAPVKPANAAPSAKAKDPGVAFRSRRALPGADAPAARTPAPVVSQPDTDRASSSVGATLKALSKTRSLSFDSLSRAALGERLRHATSLLARRDADRPKVSVAKPASAKTKPEPAPTKPQAAAPPKAPAKPAKTPAAMRKPEADPEAERLTVFGARRQSLEPKPALPQRALMISGAALLFVLAIAVWAFYLTRSAPIDLAQPNLTEESVLDIAAPDALTLPESETAPASTPEEDAVEAALGLPDAAQQQTTEAARQPESDAPDVVTSDASGPTVTAPQQDAGRLAALRSVRAFAPQSFGTLPNVQGPPAPFAETVLPPLRGQPEAAIDPVAQAQTGLPPGEDALDIVVTQGPPSSVPPARPAGIAPDPAPVVPQADNALPDAPEAAAPVPLTEDTLVIDVTQGTPPSVPPARPAGIAPELVPDPAPDAVEEGAVAPQSPDADPATPQDALDPDQASLTPPPGGVALAMFTPLPRPDAIVEQATSQAERFASATEQAVAASLRPANRPGGFSQTVQRALAAARIRAVAEPQAEVVQVAAASAAPRIPSSASVTRAATQTRAINLRQINLLGVMGTPSARRALVRLDNGRVVTVQVGERLDGGQVTAIGDSELRYNKRGRDVVLRIAS